MELRQVKLQAEQFKTQSGKQLTYPGYSSLLLSAAQQYDNQCRVQPDRIAKRRIYQHEFDYVETEEQDSCDDGTYDIDQPIDTIQVNATKYQGPRLPYEKWKELPDDAKKIWDMLSLEAKAIILCPPPKPHMDKNSRFSNQPPCQQEAPLPHHTIHETDIASLIACLHELHGGGGCTTFN